MRRVFGIYTCDEVGWWLYPRTPVAQGGKNALNWGWAPEFEIACPGVSGPMCISECFRVGRALFELGET